MWFKYLFRSPFSGKMDKTLPSERGMFTFEVLFLIIGVTIKGLPDKETAISPSRGCRTIDKGALK